MSGNTFIRGIKDRNNPYVMIRKEPLKDNKLSWKAKGILSYLLSLPDDWQIYETELVKHSTDGRDSLKSGISELLEAGYIERIEKRNEKGHFKGYNYTVFEIPHRNGKPDIGKTNIGKPDIGKPVTTNNDFTNNDLNNKEITNIKNSASGDVTSATNKDIENNFESMWKIYPNKRNKGQVSPSKKKEIYRIGEEFKRCIERYVDDVEYQRKNGFPELKYKVGSTFFNSGYIDYLDGNYESIIEERKEGLDGGLKGASGTIGEGGYSKSKYGDLSDLY